METDLTSTCRWSPTLMASVLIASRVTSASSSVRPTISSTTGCRVVSVESRRDTGQHVVKTQSGWRARRQDDFARRDGTGRPSSARDDARVRRSPPSTST